MTDPTQDVPLTVARQAATGQTGLEAHDLTTPGRLAVMLLGYLPLLHVLAVGVTLLRPWTTPGWRLVAALGVLYLAPALAARLIVRLFPFRGSVIVTGSPDFFKWWALLNLQVLFCRFPCLEEALRVVPAFYSTWLRLWGSRIGRLVYWSPGTRILDRSFLDIGDDVIFGAGTRLSPHVMVRNARGELELLLAPVRVGARSLVGGYSLLTAGTEIDADEVTRASTASPPFSRWRGGRREKREAPGMAAAREATDDL